MMIILCVTARSTGFGPAGQLGPFCVEFACLPVLSKVSSGRSGFLPFPTLIRSISYSNLPIGVNMCVNGWETRVIDNR